MLYQKFDFVSPKEMVNAVSPYIFHYNDINDII